MKPLEPALKILSLEIKMSGRITVRTGWKRAGSEDPALRIFLKVIACRKPLCQLTGVLKS